MDETEDQGRYNEAEQLQLRTLEARRRVLGAEHPQTLISMCNLACLAAVRGERDRAVELFRELLELGWAEDWVFDEPDLESLQGDPEFEEILAEIRERLAEGS